MRDGATYALLRFKNPIQILFCKKANCLGKKYGVLVNNDYICKENYSSTLS